MKREKKIRGAQQGKIDGLRNLGKYYFLGIQDTEEEGKITLMGLRDAGRRESRGRKEESRGL